MEAHIQAKHSGVEVECQECGFKCKDYNFLKLHRTMFHMGPPPPTSGAPGVVVPPPPQTITSGASPIPVAPATNPLLYLSATAGAAPVAVAPPPPITSSPLFAHFSSLPNVSQLAKALDASAAAAAIANGGGDGGRGIPDSGALLRRELLNSSLLSAAAAAAGNGPAAAAVGGSLPVGPPTAAGLLMQAVTSAQQQQQQLQPSDSTLAPISTSDKQSPIKQPVPSIRYTL